MSLVEITDADGVRLVRWDRPESLNAMNDELWDATREALVGAQADPELRCVVLTGTGRAFTAGQDLGEMMAPPDHPDGGENHGYRALMPVLEAFDKPLLAAVKEVREVGGPARVSAVAASEIRSEGPLEVDFRVLGWESRVAGDP